VNLIEAIHDARFFAEPFGGESFAAWRTFLAALFALPPTGSDLERFRQFTGRTEWPKRAVYEVWLIKGRRAGGSFISALVAVFLACFRDYSQVLAKGERGTLMVLAADKRQARTVFRYIRGLIQSVPRLERMVEAETLERIDLSNRVTIEVHPASFRSVRGYTL